MNASTILPLLLVALRGAGAPPAVVLLLERLGPTAAPILDELLRRHAAGEPLDVLLAQAPDLGRVVREVEGPDTERETGLLNPRQRAIEKACTPSPNTC